MAIASHKENHPNSIHMTEDVTDMRVVAKLKGTQQEQKRQIGNSVEVNQAKAIILDFVNSFN